MSEKPANFSGEGAVGRPQDPPEDERVLLDLETRIFYAETGVKALIESARLYRQKADALGRVPPAPAPHPLPAQRYFALAMAEWDLDEALMRAFGADVDDYETWPAGSAVYDDYDASFELHGTRDDFVPTDDQIKAALALGFARGWICYRDGTEVYVAGGKRGERKASRHGGEHEDKRTEHILVKRLRAELALGVVPAPAPQSCLCPNGHGQMARDDGPLAPGASRGPSWKCATCGIERMWPDAGVVPAPAPQEEKQHEQDSHSIRDQRETRLGSPSADESVSGAASGVDAGHRPSDRRPTVAVAEDALARLTQVIPRNWLDPLLTGPTAVIGKGPYGCDDIERLLNAIRARALAPAPGRSLPDPQEPK